jgi:hypothetical protein
VPAISPVPAAAPGLAVTPGPTAFPGPARPAPDAGGPAAGPAMFSAAPGIEIFDALRAARCRIDL